MLTSMGDIMREAYKRGWITTRDGNISIRRGNKFYITPSGVRKTILVPEMIVKGIFTPSGVGDIEYELVLYADKGKPSGELEMHRMLQEIDFKGVRAVVHLHPTYTIAAMHRGFDLQELANQFPEVSRYTKVGPTVPTLPVTSPELANETYEAMTQFKSYGRIGKNLVFDIVGQKSHGVTAIGKSPWDAFEHIERLEHICQIVLASGIDPK